MSNMKAVLETVKSFPLDPEGKQAPSPSEAKQYPSSTSEITQASSPRPHENPDENHLKIPSHEDEPENTTPNLATRVMREAKHSQAQASSSSVSAPSSKPQALEESEENKAYIRGYNDALKDMQRISNGSFVSEASESETEIPETSDNLPAPTSDTKSEDSGEEELSWYDRGYYDAKNGRNGRSVGCLEAAFEYVVGYNTALIDIPDCAEIAAESETSELPKTPKHLFREDVWVRRSAPRHLTRGQKAEFYSGYNEGGEHVYLRVRTSWPSRGSGPERTVGYYTGRKDMMRLLDLRPSQICFPQRRVDLSTIPIKIVTRELDAKVVEDQIRATRLETASRRQKCENFTRARGESVRIAISDRAYNPLQEEDLDRMFYSFSQRPPQGYPQKYFDRQLQIHAASMGFDPHRTSEIQLGPPQPFTHRLPDIQQYYPVHGSSAPQPFDGRRVHFDPVYTGSQGHGFHHHPAARGNRSGYGDVPAYFDQPASARVPFASPPPPPPPSFSPPQFLPGNARSPRYPYIDDSWEYEDNICTKTCCNNHYSEDKNDRWD